MSDIQSPAPAAPQPPQVVYQKKPRWRRVLFATTLLVGGGVVGAVIAGPGFTQGYYGWREHGWQGWQGGPNWGREMGPPGGRDAPYGMHPGEFAGRHFFPGRIERGINFLLWSADASTEQRSKITAIAQRTADELFALREKHLEGRQQLRDALAAATIDKAKIESIRTEQMKLAETASKRISDAIAEAAETLTPAQRAELARRFDQHRRWFRG